MDLDYNKLKAQIFFFVSVETVGIEIGGVANLLLPTNHLKQSEKSTTIQLYCLTNVTDHLICNLMIPTDTSC